jgi:hypothetical protein
MLAVSIVLRHIMEISLKPPVSRKERNLVAWKKSGEISMVGAVACFLGGNYSWDPGCPGIYHVLIIGP